MKYAEVSFQNIFHAMKTRWRTFLLTVLIFSAVGLCSGFLFAEKLSAAADGGAEGLQLSDFSKVDCDKSYFSSCKEALFTAYGNTVSYLNVLSGESTATQEQRAQLQEYKTQLQDFNRKALKPIQSVFNSQGNIPDAYVHPQAMDDVIAEFEKLLESTRLNIMAAESAVDILKGMDAPNTPNSDADGAYAKILTLAAQYGEYKKSEGIYERLLNQLTQEPEKVIARSLALEKKLDAASLELNEIIREINATADEMSRENYFNLSAEYDDSNAIKVTINHTHTASTPQEAFLILTIFCTLGGICCGAFFAVCREAVKTGKQKKQPSPEQQNP